MVPAQIVEAYGHAADVNDKPEYFRLHRYRFRALLAAIAQEPAHDVLEIGATPGQFTAILVRAGYHVDAVDLFPEQRAELWQRLGVNVRYCNLDEQALPYDDASFDVVVFSEVIEHLNASPLGALREMARVLRPGGRLIISTPNQHYLKSRMRTLADILLGRPFESFKEFQRSMRLVGPQRYYNHSRLYTMAELCWLLEESGLQATQTRYVDAWERVGVEARRLLRHPFRVAAKAALIGLGLCMPQARSMLLAVGRKPGT
ncbi:MAG TPA: class I SAM-dependent methyltransferase [Roseiflexaceae bacterium]|nr:class I SAM-dependent methyltransferase [Roseiflexaceae bacterium]